MAGTDLGLRIGIDGEKEFKDSLAACSAQLKNLGAEMKAVTAEFQDNSSGMDAVTAKSNVLKKSIEANDNQMKLLTSQYDRQNAVLLELSDALDRAAVEYGANSEEAGRAQNAYNKQYQAILKTETQMNKTREATANLKKQLGDLSGGVDDVGESMDEAGKKTSVFADVLKGNLVADAIKSGISALASATKELIGGAVEGYAEYEQLVGGVETLFKDSAGTVQDYANNAYKTAGLSANEYMETVTSFSASLLQSMGNDTAAAAEKADRAITDMSDNANKMGSDMSSIQNAYQGFAKQNYTMLDNLKLGYGGTKEEMQRLLDDANALNAAQGNYTNYTIDSYADIVDAIHTVQTEMGITGTTALEASTTVEGSVNSMKSAWSNFVTGLGSDNADISELSAQLIESVGTVAENVLPVVETVLENIAQAVSENGPEMIEKFVSYAIEKIPDVIALGLKMVLALVKGIADNLPKLVTAVLDTVATIIKTFADAWPDIKHIGDDIIRGVWEGIKSMASWFSEKIRGFFGAVVGEVKDALGIHSPSRVFAGIGENMALGLGQGFASEMKSIGAGIQSAIPTPTVDAVYNAAAGMINGLTAANSGAGSSLTVNLVLQNGQKIATWLLPDLRAAARNDPEVATA